MRLAYTDDVDRQSTAFLFSDNNLAQAGFRFLWNRPINPTAAPRPWTPGYALVGRFQGDNGLRGYPLRYQSGDASVLCTIEERYFTDWYPFRLFRVGGAVFADIGRTWGINPVVGTGSVGWLKDVGFGLRIGPTRSGGHEVIHVDIAFPLDGDPSIADVQLLLEKKVSF